MSIGKLAAAVGVSIDAIRFYEKRGLLPPPARRPSGFRMYDSDDLQRVGFLCKARELGFSLDEIAELMKLEGGAYSASVLASAEGIGAAMDSKLAELTRWQAALHEFAWQYARDSTSTPSFQALIKMYDRDRVREHAGINGDEFMRDADERL